MSKKRLIRTLLLWPISRIYGIVVFIRNWLFDLGVIKHEEFDIPVVVIGNLAVGGTGKTPHTEYIINILRSHYKIAVLSRGYKRQTKGFVLADDNSTPDIIGDEPYQMYRKFGESVVVAVCEKRCDGIKRIKELHPEVNLILLDDAFQHRYVKPKVAVVLTEYNRPIFKDKIMPLGRLRESISGLSRADFVIVSKCPEDIKPMTMREFEHNLNLYPYQKLYFSKYVYGALTPVFPEYATYTPELGWLTQSDTILALSGIANPRPFVRYLKQYKAKIKVKIYEDHHKFVSHDYDDISHKLAMLPGDKKFIITTEKDAVRIANDPEFPQELKSQVFYIPIQVQFVNNNNPFEIELNKEIKRKI